VFIKNEYRDLIEIYVDTYHDYLQARKDFEDSGRKYESETANGNPKKSAIVDSLEKLRKDILAYSDRLCLSPKSLERVSAEKESGSALAKALNKLE